jgi:hypothetical protein
MACRIDNLDGRPNSLIATAVCFGTPIDSHGDYVRFDEQHRAAMTERGE